MFVSVCVCVCVHVCLCVCVLQVIFQIAVASYLECALLKAIIKLG